MAAEDPKSECATQEEITAKAEKVAVNLYYRYLYFDSNTYGQTLPDGVVKYQYKPFLKDIG